MDLRIDLEDENLCGNCPMNINRKTCKAGFTREAATLVEVRNRGGYSPFFGVSEDGPVIAFQIVRPMSCVLANERAENVAKKMESLEKKVVPQKVAYRADGSRKDRGGFR